MLRESSVFRRINLVSWLMDCSAFVGEKPDFPDAFWYWVNDAVADA